MNTPAARPATFSWSGASPAASWRVTPAIATALSWRTSSSKDDRTESTSTTAAIANASPKTTAAASVIRRRTDPKARANPERIRSACTRVIVAHDPVSAAAHRLQRRAPERPVDAAAQMTDEDLDDVGIAV